MTTVKYDITLMVPLLHFTSNITITAALELVFGHGRVGGPGQLHFQQKETTYLNGKFSRTRKTVPLIHITGGITLKTTLV